MDKPVFHNNDTNIEKKLQKIGGRLTGLGPKINKICDTSLPLRLKVNPQSKNPGHKVHRGNIRLLASYFRGAAAPVYLKNNISLYLGNDQ